MLYYVAHPESKNHLGVKSIQRIFKTYLYCSLLVYTLNYFSIQDVPGVKVTTLGVTSLGDAESKTSFATIQEL
jgi:hypothetical protein